MPTAMLNNQRYQFEQLGDGPPLLLLHGFTGRLENWQTIVDALANTHRVITLDILGHGRSAAPDDPRRYQMEAVAADIIALLDYLGIAKVHLLGYSMGGRLALFTAVYHPHRLHSLTLESSSPGLATVAERQARVERDEALADWIEAHGIEAFVNRWEKLPLWESQKQLTPEQQAQLRAGRLTNQPTGLANSLRGMGTGAQPSLWDRLPKMRLPTLLLAGALDEKFVAINQQMAATIKSASLEIIPQAGHTIHLERPLIYTNHVRRFLAQFPTAL